MNKDKYERLYSGFCAEYHLISNVYRLGLEANKLVVDFGFDVIVTNQFKRMMSEYSEEHFTKLIQVKSRWFPKWETDTDGINTLSTVKYGIKEEDLNNLLLEPNSFLVCYVCLVHEEEFYIPCGIFFNNKNIKELLLEDYLEYDKNDSEFKLSLSIEAHTGLNRFNSFMRTSLEPCIQNTVEESDLAKKISDNIQEQWQEEISKIEDYSYRFKSSLHPSSIKINLKHSMEYKTLDLPPTMYDIEYLLQSTSETEILTRELYSDEADHGAGVHSFGLEHDIETSNWKEVLDSKKKNKILKII